MRYSKTSILGGMLFLLFPFVLWRFGLDNYFVLSYAIFTIFVNVLGIYFCKKNGLKGIAFSILGFVILLVGIILFFVILFFSIPG